MAYTRTFAQLSAAVQQLGGWENSADVTPAVLLQAVNYALLEGYDAMVQKNADYYTALTTLTLVSGTDTYALSSVSANFYKLRHVDVSSDGTRYFRAYPFDLDTQHRYTTAVSGSLHDLRYRMQAQNLIFAPPPPAGFARVYFIPLPVQFASTADVTLVTFDVPTEERLVVTLAARDIHVRSDLPTDNYDRQVERMSAMLRVAADGRDSGEPFSLIDDPIRDNMWDGPVDGWDV